MGRKKSNVSLIERRKVYYQNFKSRHPERLKEITRAARQRQLLKNPNYLKEHYAKNRDRYKATRQRFKLNHPDRLLLFSKLSKLKRRNVIGNYTVGEWEDLKAQYGYTCPSCLQSEPTITLTADHIVPISRGGSNYIENIQPLCRPCNSSKYTQIIKYNIKK